MKAVQTFTVVSRLPPELEPLRSIAMNLGWIADERAQELFRRIDHEQWEYVRDPAGMLAIENQSRLEALAADDEFTALAAQVHADLVRSLDSPRWFQDHHDGTLESVAYFSPEFGVAPGLPQYSGGLGVLAGDHLKAADALGLPLVGVGLFYHHGYFTQEVDDRGRQMARFPRLDADAMALEAVPDVQVTVDIAGVPVVATVWKANVGRIALYLLDTDNDHNDAEHRLITDRLYGGGQLERIRQEILLGVGGVRALDALGITPRSSTSTRATPGSSPSNASARPWLVPASPSTRPPPSCDPAACSPPTPRSPPASTGSPPGSWRTTSRAGAARWDFPWTNSWRWVTNRATSRPMHPTTPSTWPS